MHNCERDHDCVLVVSLLGQPAAFEGVKIQGVASYLRAIGAKNLSPLWAAGRMLAECTGSLVLMVQWAYSESETSVGALLIKDGDGVHVVAGGLEYDPFAAGLDHVPAGVIAMMVSSSVRATVEYGPKQVLRWLAEASEGPETLGETSPAKRVPGEASNGHAAADESDGLLGGKTTVPGWA